VWKGVRVELKYIKIIQTHKKEGAPRQSWLVQYYSAELALLIFSELNQSFFTWLVRSEEFKEAKHKTRLFVFAVIRNLIMHLFCCEYFEAGVIFGAILGTDSDEINVCFRNGCSCRCFHNTSPWK